MKTVSIVICLLCTLSPMAQEKFPDTIFTNETFATALFFPETIRQAVVGAENFKFSYNNVQAQYLGLLQATAGEDSNLLVVTTDGQVYSFILSYRQGNVPLNRFINTRESVGHEMAALDSIPVEEKEEEPQLSAMEDSIADQKKELERAAGYFIQNPGDEIESSKRGGLKLTLEKLRYYDQKTYVVLEVQNKSKIDFQLAYVHVYVTQGNKKRSSSYQKLLQHPVLELAVSEVVRHGQQKRFVLVFPKFTLGANERLEVEIRERNGSRFVELVLTNSVICLFPNIDSGKRTYSLI